MRPAAWQKGGGDGGREALLPCLQLTPRRRSLAAASRPYTQKYVPPWLLEVLLLLEMCDQREDNNAASRSVQYVWCEYSKCCTAQCSRGQRLTVVFQGTQRLPYTRPDDALPLI